ncbi:Aste57867_24659 [Aphanomyces stellatus]|uniref:histone acetyltransferase n=1 Tax=Aphanomyces stellatus TaxID=120398 RepID=A0A485LR22_9STRA|nr:hypothetical protein As57867_024581 [Aphanomyces stellatus]VFU01296.1 Aste57867_24659 [Aphanomyces stellatus]
MATMATDAGEDQKLVEDVQTQENCENGHVEAPGGNEHGEALGGAGEQVEDVDMNEGTVEEQPPIETIADTANEDGSVDVPVNASTVESSKVPDVSEDVSESAAPETTAEYATDDNATKSVAGNADVEETPQASPASSPQSEDVAPMNSDENERDAPASIVPLDGPSNGPPQVSSPPRNGSPESKEELQHHAVKCDEEGNDVDESSRKRKRSDGDEDSGEMNVIVSRDEMAKKEEDTGVLEFTVITNDGTPDRMVQLMTLKNIFSKQLPKMPKEYIVRLVFDRNHHSMVILKNKKTVVGGICYRPFLANHFGEIAFCAITASEQVKGYGTRLMNHLKEYVKTQGITHFLTYADNYAIGYFKKQGFSKVVSMVKSNWFGYIKDYDGGTLMECVIHQKINYLSITSMVQEQRKMLLEEIQKRSKANVVYPGLTSFCDSRLVNIHNVPGVKEAGWNQTIIRNSRTSRDSSTLKQQLQTLWKSLSNHRSAWPFHEPVDVNAVTDYLDYVKTPIDLSAIQKKVDENQYATKLAFKDDLILMCENCISYNAPDTNYYKAAKDLLEFIKKKVTNDVDAPPASKKHLVR